MRRGVKLDFRKKKPKPLKRDLIVEPIRKSIYDVLMANLKLAKRVGFIHRLLYIGEHNFVEGDIATNFEKNHKITNTGNMSEPLSGLLLRYHSHFCYIVEGSEQSLHKHLQLLFENEENNIRNIKVLSAVHHVKGRFQNDWMSYFGRPSERVEDIDENSDLENSMRYVTECCEKLYKFANAFLAVHAQRQSQDKPQSRSPSRDEAEGEQYVQTRIRSRSIVERDPFAFYLPELKLLDFLIGCKYLKTLDQYYDYYEYIGQSQDYSLKTWPAPKNFVPYNIFDTRYNPIGDLPVLEGQEEEEQPLSTEGGDSGDTEMTT